MSGDGRSWADFPYTRLYHSLPERMGDDYDDPAVVGAYVKLLLPADAAFPLPVPLPRWIDDVMLDRLVKADLVRLVGTSAYTMAGLAKEREAQRSGRRVGGLARAAQADRDEQGRFGPTNDHQQPTSIDTQQEPATPAITPATASSNGTSIDQLDFAGASAYPATPPRPEPPHPAPPGGRAREGGPNGSDALDDYWQLTGSFPHGRTKTWLEEMADQFGHELTGQALAAEAPDGTGNGFLGRVQNRLRRDNAQAERQEREDEKRRLREKRKAPKPVDPVVAEFTASIIEKHGDGERYVPGRSEQSA